MVMKHLHREKRNGRHSSVCFIIPEHILREVAKKGDEGQRDSALNTLVQSARVREKRELLGTLPLLGIHMGENRTICDAQHTENIPGSLVRKEGDSTSQDVTVNEAYDGCGATYDFYHEIYGRDSVDDHGLPLNSTVHYGNDYDNAFWNGSQMIYGDGRLFKRFTMSIDVIGHELTHGVTQYEAGLVYQDQPGALNESISDVFGSLVKQRVLNQKSDEADWLIGAGLLSDQVKGIALRSMKEPGTAYDDPVLGKDPQPKHMKDYQQVNYDNGGVHINSGIPNYAFYLAAMEIGGYAWEKTGKIWYITLRDRLKKTSDFQRAATATISVAGELFGQGGKEQKAVQHAWEQVGITAKSLVGASH